jgi:cytochrome c553
MKVGLGLTLLALVLAACGPLGRGAGHYASNGERIYFTGTSANGRISYRGGNLGGGMMGVGQLACADCHGSDGRGGQHLMHMTMMDAPDIRWSTLTEAEHGDHSDKEEIEHPPYDEETFKRAVTQLLDPGGNPLDPAMPRWRMSDQDLDDLMAYLKTLD